MWIWPSSSRYLISSHSLWLFPIVAVLVLKQKEGYTTIFFWVFRLPFLSSTMNHRHRQLTSDLHLSGNIYSKIITYFSSPHSPLSFSNCRHQTCNNNNNNVQKMKFDVIFLRCKDVILNIYESVFGYFLDLLLPIFC